MCSFWMFMGRICLCALFLFAGVNKILNYEATAQYMSEKGLVMVPLLLITAAIIEILGGLSLLLGYKTRYGSLLLLLFLIPVSYVMHDFWNLSGMQMQEEMIHFLSNVAIFGGLLYVFCCGAGRFSLEESLE